MMNLGIIETYMISFLVNCLDSRLGLGYTNISIPANPTDYGGRLPISLPIHRLPIL